MGRLTLAGFWVSPRLEAAFCVEALADLRDFCLALLERLLARVNGVHAEREVVGMLDGRTQDEARVFEGLEFESAVRLLEHRQLALVDDLRRREISPMHGDPGHRVIVRRIVAPLLALLQRNVQVVHRRRRGHLARGFTEAAEDDARRTARLEMLAPEIACFGCDVLHLRRQSDPELKAFGARASRNTSGMPDATACAHPFDPAGIDDAFGSGSLFIENLSIEDHGHRRDAGVRVKTDRRHALRVDVEIIQEHEGLDQLAHVGRADEPGDRPLRMAARAVGDAPGAGFGSGFGEWHVHERSFRFELGIFVLDQAPPRRESDNGRARSLLPVAAKMAFASDGATAPAVLSPVPSWSAPLR